MKDSKSPIKAPIHYERTEDINFLPIYSKYDERSKQTRRGKERAKTPPPVMSGGQPIQLKSIESGVGVYRANGKRTTKKLFIYQDKHSRDAEYYRHFVQYLKKGFTLNQKVSFISSIVEYSSALVSKETSDYIVLMSEYSALNFRKYFSQANEYIVYGQNYLLVRHCFSDYDPHIFTTDEAETIKCLLKQGFKCEEVPEESSGDSEQPGQQANGKADFEKHSDISNRFSDVKTRVKNAVADNNSEQNQIETALKNSLYKQKPTPISKGFVQRMSSNFSAQPAELSQPKSNLQPSRQSKNFRSRQSGILRDSEGDQFIYNEGSKRSGYQSRGNISKCADASLMDPSSAAENQKKERGTATPQLDGVSSEIKKEKGNGTKKLMRRKSPQLVRQNNEETQEQSPPKGYSSSNRIIDQSDVPQSKYPISAVSCQIITEEVRPHENELATPRSSCHSTRAKLQRTHLSEQNPDIVFQNNICEQNSQDCTSELSNIKQTPCLPPLPASLPQRPKRLFMASPRQSVLKNVKSQSSLLKVAPQPQIVQVTLHPQNVQIIPQPSIVKASQPSLVRATSQNQIVRGVSPNPSILKMPPQPSLARIPSSQSSIVQKETKKSRVLYLLSDQLTISEANEVRKLVEKEDTVKEFSTAKDLQLLLETPLSQFQIAYIFLKECESWQQMLPEQKDKWYLVVPNSRATTVSGQVVKVRSIKELPPLTQYFLHQ